MKYKLNINHLEKPGEIEKLRRDGFTREQISKTMYKETEGMSKDQRTELMTRLHERNQR